jgi:uncharacterized delta-60 repeat protein
MIRRITQQLSCGALLLILASFCFAGVVTLDTTFNSTGYQVQNFGTAGALAESMVIQPDGRIVLGGYTWGVAGPTDFAAMRYNPDGTLDMNFDGDGKVSTNLGPFDTARVVLVQPDGKILLGGDRYAGETNYDFAVVRYNPDGSLDNSFDFNGLVVTNRSAFSRERGYGMVLQPDGKILIVGTTAFSEEPGDNFPTAVMLVRYNADGSLDTSFNGTGTMVLSFGSLNASANAVILQPDGKILIGGFLFNGFQNDLIMMRLHPNGGLDTSFSGGIAITPVSGSNNVITTLELQADGKILAGAAVGTGSRVLRYDSDGSIDSTLGMGAIFLTQTVRKIVSRPDGKILVAGTLSGRITLSRYSANGVKDITFNNTGTVSTPVPNQTCSAYSVVEQPGRKLVAGGYCFNSSSQLNSMIAMRLNETPTRALFDYDADGRADVSVFRPSEGNWYIQNSSNMGVTSAHFGVSGDLTTPGDFDGDGKADISVYRPSEGNWYRLNSSDGSFFGTHFGAAEDKPAVGDFDGDGKADISVFRPSEGNWYRLNSSDGSFFGTHFGAAEDKPAVGDFDGDGKVDLSVFRPSEGNWYRLNSSDGSFFGTHFGAAEDKPVVGDFDGDRKADVSVFRPSEGNWYRLNSNGGSFFGTHFGLAEDKPVAADYDGDGKTDIAVFRPSEGNWYILNSDSGFLSQHFGASEDTPTPNSFVY